MGLLVDIEAISISDTGETVKAVLEALRGDGLSAATVGFPNRASFATGELISRFLSGEFQPTPRRATVDAKPLTEALAKALADMSLPPALATDLVSYPAVHNVLWQEEKREQTEITELIMQVVYSINRRERVPEIRGLLRTHDVVLAHRYALTARVYAEATGVGAEVVDALEGDLPPVDLTFLIDLDPATIAGGRERYSANIAFQSRCRSLFLSEARRQRDIVVLSGTLPPADLCRSIVERIEPLARS